MTSCDFVPSNESSLHEPSQRTEKKITLMDLPDKCLISIFKWIPLQNLDDIIGLCPRWHKLVQDHIPVEVHLTDIGFRVALHYHIGHEDLPKYRVKIAHSRVLDERLPELRSPEELEVIEFATHTESFTYESLVSKATNLRELYFGYGSLVGDVLSEMDFQFPKLKRLSILDREIHGKTLKQNGPVKPSTLSANISGFLKTYFPSLEQLSVTTVASRKQTIDYAQDLLQFIQNHCHSLKKVKFICNTQVRLAEDSAPIYANEFSLPAENFDLVKLASVKLEELDLNFGSNFFVGLEQWAYLLNNQTQLSHLAIGIDKPLNPVTFTLPVTNSSETLMSLQLGVEVFEENQNQRTPVDLSILASCKKLEMLVLRGPTPTNPELARLPSPEMLNVNKLPHSLTCLAIDNIYLESKQVSEIMGELLENGMQLKRLSLRNIGTEGGFGVTLSMLDDWLKAELLQEIIVKGVNNEGDSRMEDYKHLDKLGVKSPLKKCFLHIIYWEQSKEYRKAA